MSDHTLYDDDILLWSEQQAEVIRRLGRTRRDLPNEFDIENVAEEIESVGRSELASVESYLRLVLLHLIKLFVEAESDASRHWRSEIAGFHADLGRRYAPSMRQRIDVDGLWRSACEQAMLAYDGNEQQRVATLPSSPPLTLDDFIAERVDSVALVERLRETVTRTEK